MLPTEHPSTKTVLNKVSLSQTLLIIVNRRVVNVKIEVQESETAYIFIEFMSLKAGLCTASDPKISCYPFLEQLWFHKTFTLTRLLKLMLE